MLTNIVFTCVVSSRSHTRCTSIIECSRVEMKKNGREERGKGTSVVIGHGLVGHVHVARWNVCCSYFFKSVCVQIKKMCTYLSSKINSVLLPKYVQNFSVDAICSSLVPLQERKKELTTWCLENIVKPWFLLKDSTNSKLSHQTTWSHSWKNYGLTSYCFFCNSTGSNFVSQGIKKEE